MGGHPAQPSINDFRDWLGEKFPPDLAGPGRSGIAALPLHLDRIDWMPSPPLAPDDGPIDLTHLRRMTLGNAGLEREVLTMFSAQVAGLAGALTNLAPDTPALLHTLKGSACAIGAFAVADAASRLESLIRCGADPGEALIGLNDALVEARTAIEAILQRS
jgi:HPt (histidine-containing phosphotransfer) domain-containing protein